VGRVVFSAFVPNETPIHDMPMHDNFEMPVRVRIGDYGRLAVKRATTR
jgi:hypothetical protein